MTSRREFLKGAALIGLSQFVGPHSLLADTGSADLILRNAKIATMDPRRSMASAVAIKGGRFVAVGSEDEVMRVRSEGLSKRESAGPNGRFALNDTGKHMVLK